jgi:ATP-dependent protease ClpP protease subunit
MAFTHSGDQQMKTIRVDAPIGQESGELSAKWLRSQLPTSGEDITLQIHCEGGSVFEGFAMLDVLAAYPGKVRAIVSSMALSMGSVLLTACDEVAATENAYFMMHDCHMDGNEVTDSEAKLLGSLSERLVTMYAGKMKKPASVVRQMMAAETFLNAGEAVSCGLADKIVDASRLSISARAIPRRIVARIKAASPVGATATARWRSAVLASGGDVSAADKQNPGLRLKMIAEANRR